MGGVKSLLDGSFEHPPGYREAYELWTDALHRSEMFDQLVMSGREPRHGHAIPADAFEQRLGQQHAMRLSTAVTIELHRRGIDPDVAERAQTAALQDHERRTYNIPVRRHGESF